MARAFLNMLCLSTPVISASYLRVLYHQQLCNTMSETSSSAGELSIYTNTSPALLLTKPSSESYRRTSTDRIRYQYLL
jgi:hypothetical protein